MKYDVVMEKIVEHAKAAVCAAEGYVVVQAREEGPLEIDFSKEGPVVDFPTGKQIGTGPKVSLPFQKGETKIFQVVPGCAPTVSRRSAHISNSPHPLDRKAKIV